MIQSLPETPALLMCSPRLYEVSYVINPWMRDNLGKSSQRRAMQQWQALYEALLPLAKIHLVEQVAGSPDMVFTANAGLARGNVVALSSFYHPERQEEEKHFRRWFVEAGYKVVDLPRETPFEGEGDALFSPNSSRLWVGHGTRTSEKSHELLRSIFNADFTEPCEVQLQLIGLRLVDPRFYHLDTCFAPLESPTKHDSDPILYYPPAFDAPSLASIEEFYSPEQRIAVDESDALQFACNAVNLGRTIVLNRVSAKLESTLRDRGFDVIQVNLDEFLKAGGAAKCLVMKLTPTLHSPQKESAEQRK